jgi:hypothetical protein
VVETGTVEVDDSGGCVVVLLIGYHDLDAVQHVRRPPRLLMTVGHW